jgi:transcriptional regulator with XRE-family HTH domain
MPIPAISKQFGAVTRKHRLSACVSQELLAERAGLHPTYISMVERGLRNPTLDVAARIAHGLGASLHKLVEEAQRGRSNPARGTRR